MAEEYRGKIAGGLPPLKARLVLHRDNQGWILEKFAVRLAENLGGFGVEAEISDAPSASADINHWMLYLYYDGSHLTRATALITHIDQFSKLRLLKAAFDTLDAGICLSRMTVETLVRRGVKREKLCYVTPAHDGLARQKRIAIGITSRAYGDGRKREGMLVELACAMRLDAFHFEIIGDGWERIIAALEAAGATVTYHRGSDDFEGDYALTLERIAKFDYYLYTGLDEGSMGFLDALAAGVPTIVTPQGFHLDVEGGIFYPFTDVKDLIGVFITIAKERQRRIDSVKGLTWATYARRHAQVWQALAEGRSAASALESERPAATSRAIRFGGWEAAVEDALFYAAPVVRRLKRLAKRR